MKAGEDSGPAALELRRVHKAYEDAGERHEVLVGADFRVAPGELVALLGRSGTGKSTLLNLVAGLDRPDQGEVHVGGERLDQRDEAARTRFRRRHVGLVFQFFNLIPTLSVRENTLLSVELNGLGRAAGKRALDRLADLGLGERLEAWPEELSGGERQRVAIAGALAHEPDLLLADEPTGSLDVETAQSVLERLVQETREAGRAAVLATHSPEVAAAADRVVRIERGAIVGVPAEPAA